MTCLPLKSFIGEGKGRGGRGAEQRKSCLLCTSLNSKWDKCAETLRSAEEQPEGTQPLIIHILSSHHPHALRALFLAMNPNQSGLAPSRTAHRDTGTLGHTALGPGEAVSGCLRQRDAAKSPRKNHGSCTMTRE